MPAVSEALALKLLKETPANKFAAWMKEKYTLPRKEGQTRGAAPIQEGMNPKTWIPNQLNYIIENGEISPAFREEIADYQSARKYESLTEAEVMAQLAKKMGAEKFDEYQEMLQQARMAALKAKAN